MAANQTEPTQNSNPFEHHKAMIEEIEAASQWWATQLERSVLARAVVDRFKSALTSSLTIRFEDHWHQDEPWRGSAYRSLCNDHVLDPVICRAAETAGLLKIESLLHHTKNLVLFVNPDEVKVFSIAFGVKQPREIVFQRYPDRQSPSPPPGFVSPSKAKPPPPSSSDSDDETKEGMKKKLQLDSFQRFGSGEASSSSSSSPSSSTASSDRSSTSTPPGLAPASSSSPSSTPVSMIGKSAIFSGKRHVSAQLSRPFVQLASAAGAATAMTSS